MIRQQHAARCWPATASDVGQRRREFFRAANVFLFCSAVCCQRKMMEQIPMGTSHICPYSIFVTDIEG